MGHLLEKATYSDIILGLAIRGTINKEIIYRVRRGNGFYSTKEGVYYQDKYPYFVPTSINNTESNYVRSAFAQAVSEWQTDLTTTEKQTYRKRANMRGGLSGYNLYISERVKELIK